MSVEDSNPLSVILEPAIVGSILVMSVYFNRNKNPQYARVPTAEKDFEDEPPKTRQRQLCGRFTINSKNTAVNKNSRVSRFLNTYPFIIEVFYLLLTYWIYQLSRAMTALSFEESTTELARRNAIRVLDVEKALHIDFELGIQKWFHEHQIFLSMLNRIYSFIHIPATCAFFGWLYYTESKENFSRMRRTMATCNWIAFFIFTFYPCAPPRFLTDYGFVDTVHSTKVASIWTTNRFCNQYAAMPSLHFGYSFLIGVSLFLYGKVWYKRLNFFAFLYPIIILTAIVATANHFILDAVAGFFVCCLAFAGNRVLLNFLILEDFVFYYLRIHKPPHRDDMENAGKGEEMEEFLANGKDIEV